jgi:hypothetical protein
MQQITLSTTRGVVATSDAKSFIAPHNGSIGAARAAGLG